MKKDSNKIWLSHSGIEILNRCPRCFWLKYNERISQPEGIVTRLPDRFDRVIKHYFDKFRNKSELPPIVRGKIEGKLENPFQEKYFHPINEKYGFLGKLDECLVNSRNQYIPVDFKTSSSDPRGREAFPAYQNQLDEFAFLLEANGKKTAGIGHLIYFYPDYGDNLHNGFPMIIHVETLKTHPELVKPRLLRAIEVLESNIPQPAKDCPFCKWYEEITKFLNINSSKGRTINQIKEVSSKMPESIYSKTVRASSKTYFFDIKESQSGDKYLQITESRLRQGGERYRSNIVIFKEHFAEFRRALDEIAEKL